MFKLTLAQYRYLNLSKIFLTSADIYRVYLRNILMVDTGSNHTSCFLLLLKLGVVRGEGSDVLHYYFVRFSSKAIDSEASETKNRVIIFCVINWHEGGQ